MAASMAAWATTAAVRLALCSARAFSLNKFNVSSSDMPLSASTVAAATPPPRSAASTCTRKTVRSSKTPPRGRRSGRPRRRQYTMVRWRCIVASLTLQLLRPASAIRRGHRDTCVCVHGRPQYRGGGSTACPPPSHVFRALRQHASAH
jgi:hypothetical protein